MPSTISKNDLQCEIAAFEARFDNAYRYLDLCGELLSQIREQLPEWWPDSPTPEGGSVVHQSLPVACQINTRRLSILKAGDSQMPYREFSGLVETIAQSAPKFYELTATLLKIPNTIRLGSRFAFFLPCESVEDAEELLVQSEDSSLMRKLTESEGTSLYSVAHTLTTHEQLTGIRRTHRINVVKRLRTGPAEVGNEYMTPPEGLHPKAVGVRIDIDSATRPAEGHMFAVSTLIKDSLRYSTDRTTELLNWLLWRRETFK